MKGSDYQEMIELRRRVILGLNMSEAVGILDWSNLERVTNFYQRKRDQIYFEFS